MLENKRPINLNLFTIHFPVTAIVSILHRITGVLLFLYLPIALWLLDTSLDSSEGYQRTRELFVSGAFRLMIWIGLVSYAFHFFAGIRHLIMDLGHSEGLKAARTSSWLILLFTIIAAGLLGVWLW